MFTMHCGHYAFHYIKIIYVYIIVHVLYPNVIESKIWENHLFKIFYPNKDQRQHTAINYICKPLHTQVIV